MTTSDKTLSMLEHQKQPIPPSGLVPRAETVFWHGEDILIRPIRPDDQDAYAAFAKRLRPDDLREPT